MRIIIHSLLLSGTIYNLVFSQLAKISYVDRGIRNLERDLGSQINNIENQINDLERKLGITLSKIESNASHISRIYPNGIPREVYLYNRGNLEKDKPYKTTAKIQYTNDGSIKEIDRFHDNGNIMLTGGFIAEQPNGKWIEWYENGQKSSETNYKNGKKDGLMTEWHENGMKIKEGKYLNDLMEGEWYFKFYHEKEKRWVSLKKGLFKSGDGGNPGINSGIPNNGRHGLFTFFYENGQKESEATYQDGNQVGPTTKWYENGQKENEGYLKNINGKAVWNGSYISWYENGQKRVEHSFVDGMNVGKHQAWFDTGTKQWEYYHNDDGTRDSTKLTSRWYENGQKWYEGYIKTINDKVVWNGSYIEWDENGKIKLELNYKNGIRVD